MNRTEAVANAAKVVVCFQILYGNEYNHANTIKIVQNYFPTKYRDDTEFTYEMIKRYALEYLEIIFYSLLKDLKDKKD